MSKIRSVAEVQEELSAKQKTLNDMFTEATTDEGIQMTADQLEDVQAKNEELNDLGTELEKARELDAIYQKNQADIRAQKQPARTLPLPQGKAPQGNEGNGQPSPLAIKSLGPANSRVRSL